MNRAEPGASASEAFKIDKPTAPEVPLVFASPHSGDQYPADFIAAARLDPVSLRRSEDAFVDQLYAAAPRHGAPLLRALFPRAYVDPNRERLELDPRMFHDPLPDGASTRSPRVIAGLGTVAKVVTNGETIYRDKLGFDEVERRLSRCYDPYHAALRGLINHSLDRFGGCILIDCHSMPSVGGPMEKDPGENRVGFVLGDRFGASCDRTLTGFVESELQKHGHRVKRNSPYAGGFTTRHYGRPLGGVHVLQIEVNRALYMDEDVIEKLPAFNDLQAQLTELIAALAAQAQDLIGC
ncbi:MAG: N-formylglutamate amidohydrolase [Magnetospiraceae bacterium]